VWLKRDFPLPARTKGCSERGEGSAQRVRKITYSRWSVIAKEHPGRKRELPLRTKEDKHKKWDLIPGINWGKKKAVKSAQEGT